MIQTMAQKKSPIVGYAVKYIPTFNAIRFAGLRSELYGAFEDYDAAKELCDSLNLGGPLDELHVGFSVQPLYEIPEGVTLAKSVSGTK